MSLGGEVWAALSSFSLFLCRTVVDADLCRDEFVAVRDRDRRSSGASLWTTKHPPVSLSSLDLRLSAGRAELGRVLDVGPLPRGLALSVLSSCEWFLWLYGCPLADAGLAGMLALACVAWGTGVRAPDLPRGDSAHTSLDLLIGSLGEGTVLVRLFEAVCIGRGIEADLTREVVGVRALPSRVAEVCVGVRARLSRVAEDCVGVVLGVGVRH